MCALCDGTAPAPRIGCVVIDENTAQLHQAGEWLTARRTVTDEWVVDRPADRHLADIAHTAYRSWMIERALEQLRNPRPKLRTLAACRSGDHPACTAVGVWPDEACDCRCHQPGDYAPEFASDPRVA